MTNPLDALLVDEEPAPAPDLLREVQRYVRKRFGAEGLRVLEHAWARRQARAVAELRLPRQARLKKPARAMPMGTAICEGCQCQAVVSLVRRVPALPKDWIGCGTTKHPWPLAMWCPTCQAEAATTSPR